MGKSRHDYQAILGQIQAWIEASVHQDVLDLMDVVEKGKAYIRAATDLGKDEMLQFERFLMRDFQAASQQLQQDMDNSPWWQGAKFRLWQTLATLSDKNQLALFEMQQDLTHNGIYKAGELIALGRLNCTLCGHIHDVTFVETIAPCMQCGGTDFVRIDNPET